MSTTPLPFALSLSGDWINSLTYLSTRGSYSRSDFDGRATSQMRRFHECPSGDLSIVICTVDESPMCVPSYQEPLLQRLVDPKTVFTALRLQTSSSQGLTRTKSPCFSWSSFTAGNIGLCIRYRMPKISWEMLQRDLENDAVCGRIFDKCRWITYFVHYGCRYMLLSERNNT